MITSLPKWETSHCYKDLKLVFPIFGEKEINLELQRYGLLYCKDFPLAGGGTRVVWW